MERAKVVTTLQNNNLKSLCLCYKDSLTIHLKSLCLCYKDSLTIHLKSLCLCYKDSLTIHKQVRLNYSSESNSNKRINKNKYLRRSKMIDQTFKESTEDVITKEQKQGTYKATDDTCKEKEIKRSGCKDVVILSDPEDHGVVQSIKERLQDLETRITVDIFDDIHLGKPEIESLRLICEQYHIILVYATQNFSKNKLRFLMAQDLLYNSCETNEQVIPVFEKKSDNGNFPGIKGITLENQEMIWQKLIEESVLAVRR